MEQGRESSTALEGEEGRTALAPGRQTSQSGRSLKGTFASLGYRDFLFLWLGQISHAGALWLEQTARPLLILAITGSPVHLGLVILVRTIPSVGFGLVAGVLADSFNRRAILLLTKIAVLVLSAVFALLVVTGSIEIWHIYAFSFLRGVTMAFDQPARRAMIPSMVPSHLIMNAMALSSGSMTAMRIIGAASAGLLIGFFGIAAPFIVIVFIYIAAVVFTWLLRTPDHARSGYQGMRRIGEDMVEGLRFAWNTPAIRGILVISMGYFTFGMAFMQVFAPLFAKQVLGIGDEGFGFMISTMGVGGLMGALVLASVSPQKQRGVIMLVMLIVLGLLLILFSAVTYLQTVVLAFAIVLLLGIGQSVFFPLTNAVLIELAPENMRGRVMGLLSLDRAMTALGGALAGFLAAGVGTQPAQILFGIGCVATAVVMLTMSPTLRRIQ